MRLVASPPRGDSLVLLFKLLGPSIDRERLQSFDASGVQLLSRCALGVLKVWSR